jgi:predicted GNAT family acetyltransferase
MGMTTDSPTTASTTTPADATPTEAATPAFRHEPALSRYSLMMDGATAGFADYEIDGSRVLFTHVEVDPRHRGEGLASILVEQALDDMRERTDLTVVAVCPYVVAWIDKHAEYQDLLTRGR